MPDRVEETKAAIDKADIQSPDGAPPEESPRGRVISSIGTERDQELGVSGRTASEPAAPIRRRPGARDETRPRAPQESAALEDGLEAKELATDGMNSPGTRGRVRGRGQGRGPSGRSPRGRGPSTPSKG
jgi:hypothetical protein